MVPGGRMNPKQMKQMMKRLGIEQEEIAGVEEVVIRTATKEYVFSRAQVTMMTVQGQKTVQVVGEPLIRDRPGSKAAVATPRRDHEPPGGLLPTPDAFKGAPLAGAMRARVREVLGVWAPMLIGLVLLALALHLLITPRAPPGR